MFLYLIQHGEAAAKEIDPERGLSGKGRRDSLKCARFLKSLKQPIHVIWHSCKTRSCETAGIIAETLDIPQRLLEHSALSPHDDIMPLIQELEKASRNKIIVGHLPSLQKLASRLLSGFEDELNIAFYNSGIFCVEKIGKKWKLIWSLAPEHLPDIPDES